MDTRHDGGHKRARQHGLTLIEMMVVVAVTVIVGATAVPSLTNLIDRRHLDAAANQLAADIQFVRSEAVARNRPIRLSFHGDADSSCWIVHTGTPAQCSCSGGSAAVCTAGAIEIKTVAMAAIDRVALQTNVASMLFDPMHGTTTPAGTLRLVGAGGREVRHIVNVMGRVRSCTPNGATGWRSC